MRAFQILGLLSVACLLSAAAPSPEKKPPAKPPATKQVKPAGSPAAAGKGDPYSATVPVDANASAASVAQTLAINAGRARAWNQVSHRLVPQKDWSKLPQMDDAGLERLIRGYTVANEKRSTTRYMARVTYIFNPGAVRHLFRVSNIAFGDQPGTAILVVAMSPTYAADSPWARAFAQPKYAAAQFAIVSPIGDAVDQGALGQLHFGDASWADVEPVASRVHANEAVLVLAGNPTASQMTVRIRRIGPGRPFPLSDVVVPGGGSPSAAYSTAAEQVVGAIEDNWKLRTAIDFGRKSKLIADARIISLEDWSGLLAKLAAIPVVSDVTVQAMNVGDARISLTYAGTQEQLHDIAAQNNLSITNRDGTWWISNGKLPADSVDDQSNGQ